MLIVSTPNLENQKIKEYLGIVTGSTVELEMLEVIYWRI